jgi:hypothetical protein
VITAWPAHTSDGKPKAGKCELRIVPGRYRSGQTGQTVNLLAYAFSGSNPLLPILRPGTSKGHSLRRSMPFVARRQPSVGGLFIFFAPSQARRLRMASHTSPRHVKGPLAKTKYPLRSSASAERLEFGQFFVVGERLRKRFFSLSGGFEHQIQGGGPNGEALHCLGIFLTLFAQEANEIEQGWSGWRTAPLWWWKIVAGTLRSVGAQRGP